MRKLRRAAKATEGGIEVAAQILEHRLHDVGRELGRCRRTARQRADKSLVHLFVLSGDLRALLSPDGGDALAHVGECGHAVARLLRKIGAAKEGCAFGREEHREGPAARALREHLVRRLVDLVQVGPLLAIDLDADEEAVHHRGHGRIFEALVRHDMAPVAGRIADRQQNRLVFTTRPLQRLLSPGIPVHGVAGMLLEVGRGFLREAIHLIGSGLRDEDGRASSLTSGPYAQPPRGRGARLLVR